MLFGKGKGRGREGMVYVIWDWDWSRSWTLGVCIEAESENAAWFDLWEAYQH